MKKSLSKVLILSAALLLASCGGGDKTSSPAAETSVPAETSVTSEGGASEPAGTSTPTGTSTPAGTSTPTSTPAGSSEASQEAIAFTGIDVIAENDKAYAKITGTISGFANAAAMKMAFGLVSGQNYIMGSATPADADYKYAPVVDATAGTFELKVDLSGATLAQGDYTAMCGPKGHYAAVGGQQATGVTYGTGKAVANGFRFSVRSHNGAIALDELPPISMTISQVVVEGEGAEAKVYHIVGGLLNTTKMPKATFEASTPLMVYETTVGGWKQYTSNYAGTDQNKINNNILTTTVSVDAQGNALIKTDVTSLPNDRYNVKVNLDNTVTQYADTQMDVVIDTSANPVIHGNHSYVCYADSSHSGDKAYIYGNCGLIIEHHHVLTDTKAETSALHTVACADGDLSYYELRAAEATTGQKTPSETGTDDNAKKTRLGKNNIFDDVWDITGIASGEYEIYLEARASAGNASKGYWNSATAIANGDKASNNGNTAALQADYKYKVKIDSGEYVNLGNDTDNYAAVGLAEDAKHWTNKALATVMISGDATSLTVHNMDNGYALWVYGVRLVRVGNYIKPATQVTFTENVMRIEAEDTHGYPINNKSGTITAEGEGEDFSGDKIVAGLGYQSGSWNSSAVAGQLDFIMKATEARAIKVKVHLKSNQTTSQKVASLSLNGIKIADISAADTWTDSTSEAFNMPVGEFTLSIKGVNANYTADIDYIEILDQGAPLHEHTLVDGTAAQNTSGKDVIPFECSGCHKKGAKIAVTDFEGESSASIDSNNSDGSFKPKKVDIAYKLIVPETGYYTISLGMLISSNTTRAMSDRHFIVKLGETTLPLTLDGTATPESLGIATSGDPTDVILAGAQLEAGEVTISINNSDYRVGFKGYVSIMQAEAPAS